MLHKPVNRIVYDGEGKVCGVVSVDEEGKVRMCVWMCVWMCVGM